MAPRRLPPNLRRALLPVAADHLVNEVHVGYDLVTHRDARHLLQRWIQRYHFTDERVLGLQRVYVNTNSRNDTIQLLMLNPHFITNLGRAEIIKLAGGPREPNSAFPLP